MESDEASITVLRPKIPPNKRVSNQFHHYVTHKATMVLI